MTTQVTVPDGGTTVVGGVLFDDERESQDRTPGLASIPVLGNLFKRKGVQRNTNEILFFITPRISRPDYAATDTGRYRSKTDIDPSAGSDGQSAVKLTAGRRYTAGFPAYLPVARPHQTRSRRGSNAG